MAGIIAAEVDNAIGISGVAGNARHKLRAGFNPGGGYLEDDDLAAAIRMRITERA